MLDCNAMKQWNFTSQTTMNSETSSPSETKSTFFKTVFQSQGSGECSTKRGELISLKKGSRPW